MSKKIKLGAFLLLLLFTTALIAPSCSKQIDEPIPVPPKKGGG
jgi:hypothetical protein